LFDALPKFAELAILVERVKAGVTNGATLFLVCPAKSGREDTADFDLAVRECSKIHRECRDRLWTKVCNEVRIQGEIR